MSNAIKTYLSTFIDGIKFRCRAGMGRCQGGFCLPRVMEILSRELNIPYDEVSKRGKFSQYLVNKVLCIELTDKSKETGVVTNK